MFRPVDKVVKDDTVKIDPFSNNHNAPLMDALKVLLEDDAAIDENLLNMNRMLEDIDYLQMQSQLLFESGSSAGRSLQGY